MTITNKTRRPISVPLPGGKRLHLGPGKTAQITPKAAEHPPLVALVEAGDVELSGGDRKQARSLGGAKGPAGKPGHSGGTGGIRHTGDR